MRAGRGLKSIRSATMNSSGVCYIRVVTRNGRNAMGWAQSTIPLAGLIRLRARDLGAGSRVRLQPRVQLYRTSRATDKEQPPMSRSSVRWTDTQTCRPNLPAREPSQDFFDFFDPAAPEAGHAHPVSVHPGTPAKFAPRGQLIAMFMRARCRSSC